MADTLNIVTLFLFFFGVALCFWRVPQADRWHLVLCLVAAGLWGSLPLLNPSTRTPMFAVVTSSFLIMALAQYFQRRTGS
jgi:hypothetical protein